MNVTEVVEATKVERGGGGQRGGGVEGRRPRFSLPHANVCALGKQHVQTGMAESHAGGSVRELLMLVLPTHFWHFFKLAT
jgi:hypothetical protein